MQQCLVSIVSFLLYIIALEIKAISIRQNETIIGLQLGAECEHINIFQYADDGVFFLNKGCELVEAINTIR